MKSQFPFKVPYTITQGYDSVAARYNYNHHGAVDAVPNPKLSDIYPILPGYVLDVGDFSAQRGKAVYINSEIDAGLIAYLKSRGFIPLDYNGRVFIKHSYHHGLKIYVKQGQVVNQDTPLMLCGNTGMVYSGGVPVPDNEKGVEPYRGLHVHFDTVIHPNNTSHPFNLDWDRSGRVDPLIILNYKGTSMNPLIEFVHLAGTKEYGFLESTAFTKLYHRAIDEAFIKEQARGYQMNIVNPDGSINYSTARDISV